MSRKSEAADPAVNLGTEQDMAKAGRLKQIRMVAGLVQKANPKAMPIIIGSGLYVAARGKMVGDAVE